MTSRALFGCHVSIAGGIDKSISRAEELSLGAMQIFSKNASRWQSPPLDIEVVERFKQARNQSAVGYIAVHDSYLINLANPEPSNWIRSVDAFVDEMERCKTLGIQDLVMHPGAHLGSGESAGIRQIITALDQATDRAGTDVRILLETTAGQGSSLGWCFKHLAEIICGCRHENLAVCFDSCHVFAAGYDMRSKEDITTLLETFDSQIGLENLALFHINDSKKGCGSRVDRHQHIGQGEIGEAGFEALLADPRLKDIPKIIETPSGPDHRDDLQNLALIRQFSGAQNR